MDDDQQGGGSAHAVRGQGRRRKSWLRHVEVLQVRTLHAQLAGAIGRIPLVPWLSRRLGGGLTSPPSSPSASPNAAPIASGTASTAIMFAWQRRPSPVVSPANGTQASPVKPAI